MFKFRFDKIANFIFLFLKNLSTLDSNKRNDWFLKGNNFFVNLWEFYQLNKIEAVSWFTEIVLYFYDYWICLFFDNQFNIFNLQSKFYQLEAISIILVYLFTVIITQRLKVCKKLKNFKNFTLIFILIQIFKIKYL